MNDVRRFTVTLEPRLDRITRTASVVLASDYDALAQQLAEANRKLKNYEPIALYNGKSIEQYAAELAACREANEALRVALEEMVNRWEPDTAGADRRMWERAVAALALKPSDAKEGT